MRADSVRAEVLRLVRQVPFQPFVLVMDNGDQVTIGRPENIAFDPEGLSSDFGAISNRARWFGAFEAVASVAATGPTSPLV